MDGQVRLIQKSHSMGFQFKEIDDATTSAQTQVAPGHNPILGE